MDAMVTARMPSGKKEAGARALEELGTNASKAVNDLYDYVIAYGRLPFERDGPGREERVAQAEALVDSIPRVVLEPGLEGLDLKAARALRLRDHGLSGGAH